MWIFVLIFFNKNVWRLAEVKAMFQKYSLYVNMDMYFGGSVRKITDGEQE